MEEKNTNHACMNERSFLEFHMARSTCGNGHWQFPSDAWQHRDVAKRNREGALNSYKIGEIENGKNLLSDGKKCFREGSYL